MGVIGKLAFWRKSSKKATAVESFEVPAAQQLQSPRGSEPVKAPAPPALEVTSAEQITTRSQDDKKAANSPLRAPASFEAEASPKAASSSSLAAASSAPSSPPRSRVSPVAAMAVEGSPPPQPIDLCTDADDLERELCGDVLAPLQQEPKVSPGRAVSTQEESDFNKSLPEVFAGVSQAFGPMIASSLQSPKWDKRAQALKAVGTMLHGLDLQGMAPPGSTGFLGKASLNLKSRVDCWRSCCELLHYVMCDKVMPVRLAAHELFMDAFANAECLVEQAECHKALDVLIPHLFDRLGDSNLRLHESARKCVVFCAEQPFLIGLSAVLQKLQARLTSCSKGGERQKTCFGVLDACNVLLQHFPGRRASSRNLNDEDDEDEAADSAVAPGGSWTALDIAPFIDAGMDDSLGPRVRSTVVALAVMVYQTFGMEAMTPVLEGLRPAKQVLLRQKFQESEDMDPDDFVRSTHCGTTASTMAPRDNDGVNRSESLSDMIVQGSAVKLAGMNPMKLPGCLDDADEENLMDAVLEETGMVFGGACIGNEANFFGRDARCLRPMQGISRTLLEDDLDLEEEHRILEEELRQLDLDMDLEAIVEQEALLEDHRMNGMPGMMRQELDVMEVC